MLQGLIAFLNMIVYVFAIVSFLYFLFLFVRKRFRDKVFSSRELKFVKAEDSQKNLELAREMVRAARTVQENLPVDLEDIVKEAFENPDHYTDRRAEIQSKALKHAFGFNVCTYTAHRNMAEFALRYLDPKEIPTMTESSGREVKWDVGTLIYYSRWAALREDVILRIVDYIKTFPRSRFATDEGLARNAEIESRIQDYRATAGSIAKKLRQEKSVVMSDRELSAEDKARQCRDLEILADAELKSLQSKLEIKHQLGEEETFLAKLKRRVHMMRTAQEAKAELKKTAEENPSMGEAIDDLIADIDSGDWKDWRA